MDARQVATKRQFPFSTLTWVIFAAAVWVIADFSASALLAADTSVIADLPSGAVLSQVTAESVRNTKPTLPVVFKKVPSEVEGLPCVAPKYKPQEKPGEGYSFKVTKNCTVYFIVTERGNPTLPSDWQKTSLTGISKMDKWTTKDLYYKRDYQAGDTVTVPAHEGKKQNGKYAYAIAAAVKAK